MTLEEMLNKKEYDQIWQRYCGFLDISLAEFMEIQNRLMLEQLELYADCELGRRIFQGKKPASVAEYRSMIPLTSYEDYADILLPKVDSALPAKPVLWIETTWEGGRKPVKVAPYTEGMLKSHKANTIACMLLATSNKKGHFTLRGGENFLYGMAQLPYLTGLVPHLVSSELWINFMPSTKEAAAMRFSQRSKAGFKMGLQSGVDLFFGMSSVIAKISDTFTLGSGAGEKLNILKVSPKMGYRLFKARMNSKQKKIPVKPKDIWTLKGLICAGTDTPGLKKKIENYWGIKPLEIFGGTEPTCIATETWSKDGLVFFPDVCFYEFIPRWELEKNIDDPSYIPHTYLLDELVAGNEYELVISSFKGGAFARYRMGDIFKCLSLSEEEDGVNLPHFSYVDRHPSVIDLAGFTRITENTINEALALSKLDIARWFAVKEFDEGNRAFLHLYVEVGFCGPHSALTKDIIKEHLSIYFRYVDTDYNDLKYLLGIDPLVISIIPAGTISRFSDKFGRNLWKMNPSHFDVIEVLKIARGESGKGEL